MTSFTSWRGAARRKNNVNVEVNMNGIVQGSVRYRKVDPAVEEEQPA
jgi:hypothetical protein